MSVAVSVNNLRKALYPVFVLAAVFGVQMFEYRVVFLNYIQYIVMWSSYTVIFWCLWLWSDFRLIFSNYTYQFVIFANSITSLMATALTLQHKKKFQRVLEGLTIINNTFGVLNIPNQCSKLERLVWKVIGLWCMIILYVIVTDASWMTFSFGKVIGPLVILIFNYPYFVNAITYIIICLMLSYTESRFELLNKHIEKLMSQKAISTGWSFEETYGVTGQLNPISMSKRKQDIWTLMHIHAELCKICRDLNTIFGVQITFEIASYFVYVCGLAVYFCEMYDVKSYVTTTVHLSEEALFRLVMACWWACIYIGRLIYFNHVCETVSAQAHKTGSLMLDILNCATDSRLQEEMRQFILYMINKPLRFYGAGLFCFGYKFIHTFFGGIITVVVIIIQSRSPDDMSTFGIFVIPENVTSDVVILLNDVIVPINSSLVDVEPLIHHI